MIARPSCPQLIEAVRTALRDQIAPALDDKGIQSMLGMVDTLLENAARRCEHEIAWMREEIADIEKVAGRLLAAGIDKDSRIANALAELRSRRTPSDHTPDVADDYNRAGELLSLCLETELDDNSELHCAVEDVLYARVAREAEIRGAFALVGRT